MTRVRDKYEWRVGALPPVIDPHSIVKHDLIRNYVSRYIHVLLSNPKIESLALSIIDGFAGGGEYRAINGHDYQDGSPLLAIQTVLEAESRLNIGREKTRRVFGEYFFVEKERSNFNYLKATLIQRYGAQRLSEDIRLYNTTFQSAVDDIIARIKARKCGERSLFLLDQYAYDQVPVALLKTIFGSLRGAEVLLTFNVDSLISFLSDSTKSRNKLAEIGLDQYVDWSSLSRLKETDPAWKAQIQRYLARGIVEQSGARFSTIFYITPAGSTAWTYWLVHLSNAYRARDVMMELHWALANHFSHFLEPDLFFLGHRSGVGTKLRDQPDLNFGEAFHFDAVASERCQSGLGPKLVSRIFESDGVRLGDLLYAIGNNTPATSRMICLALDAPIRAGDIEVVSIAGVRRRRAGALETTDMMRPSLQRPMVFLPNRLNSL